MPPVAFCSPFSFKLMMVTLCHPNPSRMSPHKGNCTRVCFFLMILYTARHYGCTNETYTGAYEKSPFPPCTYGTASFSVRKVLGTSSSPPNVCELWHLSW